MKRGISPTLPAAIGGFAPSYDTRTVRMESHGRRMKMKVLQPKETSGPAPGILWILQGFWNLGKLY